MAHVASDRNAYDRCYFNAHDRTGDVFLVTGLGDLPEPRRHRRLRHGAGRRPADHGAGVRRARGHDRLRPVGRPVPHRGDRAAASGSASCATATTTASASTSPGRARSPRSTRSRHVMRSGHGRSSSTPPLRPGGHLGGRAPRRRRRRSRSTRTRGSARRDRSWGIRPVGEAEPPGRAGDEPIEGFWWLYVPLRFDDFAIVVIVQEDADGHRILNDAMRVWPARRAAPRAAGLAASSTSTTGPAPAIPSGATLHLTEPDGTPLASRSRRSATSRSTPAPATAATPTGATASGRAATGSRASVVDMNDPGRRRHVAVRHDRPRRPRPRVDDAEGWGLFEHGTFGRHDPTGFTDFGSVAP